MDEVHGCSDQMEDRLGWCLKMKRDDISSAYNNAFTQSCNFKKFLEFGFSKKSSKILKCLFLLSDFPPVFTERRDF